MSNQCSNLFNYRSFSLRIPFYTPLKPYSTTLTPIFPFHKNHIVIGRRSRRSSSSLLPPLAAQSSSDTVLISTTEHSDGSLVFRFGDACEVVKNDDVVKEIESQDEQESDVNVLDGDQERQVINETIETGYESDGGRLTEVADADIDSNIAERETNVIYDLRDYQAELSERLSDIYVEELISSPSDVDINNSLKGVEIIDRTKCASEFDGDESSNPTISFLDNGPNHDEIENPSVSVKSESRQISEIEVMDGKESYLEDELDKAKTEDTSESDTKDLMPSAIPFPMPISDIELTDAVNEDVEEELQVMIINEIPPSDSSGAESTLEEVSELQSEIFNDQAMEDELQQMSTNNREENAVAYVMPISSIEDAEPIVEEEVNQPQSTPLDLNPTMQVSDIELQDTVGQNLDDAISQVNDESEGSSVSVDLEGMQVSNIDIKDETQPYAEDELHNVETEETSEGDMKDLLPLATMHNSDDELTDAANEDIEDVLQGLNISEDTPIDGMRPCNPLEAKPILDEVSQLQSSHVKLEATMEVSHTKSLDVKEPAMEDNVSTNENQKQVSDIEKKDTMGQNLDDDILQVDDQSEDSSVSVKLQEVMDVSQPNAEDEMQKVNTEDTCESDSEHLLPPAMTHISDVEVTDAAFKDMEEESQDMNISEGILLEGLLPLSSLGDEEIFDEVSQLQSSNMKLERTMEVSTTTGMDFEDQKVEDELQQVSVDNRDEKDVANVTIAETDLEEEVNSHHSTPVELKPAMKTSDIEVQDATGQNLDDGTLPIIDHDVGDSYIKDVEQSFHQLEPQIVHDEGVNYNMLEQCAETDALESFIQLKQSALDALMETEITEGELSSSEFSEASEDTALQLVTEAEVEREKIYLTGNFLSSGAALLEHQFKALAGGDDAYFVAGGKWLGLANGVSQWSFEGTGPGVYAQELMRTCEEIVLNTSSLSVTNPVELLCRGVRETNMSGSSNVLIANFDGQALHVANVGDTGFLIIRHDAIYKRSSPLLHEFHFALQVEDSDDPLQLVEEHRIELEEGDIVVSATDGLFDNLYEQEIAMIVSKSMQAGMKPEEIAKLLATRAQEVGRSAFLRSPFSDAAQAAGYTGYAGGKPDNVAVIVSVVEK